MFKPTARPARPPTTTVVLQASNQNAPPMLTLKHSRTHFRHTNTETQTHRHTQIYTHAHTHMHTHTRTQPRRTIMMCHAHRTDSSGQHTKHVFIAPQHSWLPVATLLSSASSLSSSSTARILHSPVGRTSPPVERFVHHPSWLLTVHASLNVHPTTLRNLTLLRWVTCPPRRPRLAP